MFGLRNVSPRSITVDTIETGTATPESTEKQRELPPVETLPEYKDTGKIELPAAYCSEKLGFAFPTRRKWLILTVIFIVQMSMNFNASIYGNAVVALKEEFGITTQMAMLGQMVFLVAYGVGSEMWAPWSEEWGRKPIMQLSLLFVNIWQIPCALSPSFGGILACRLLGGLSSAGGSVTLGMVADMYDVDNHQYALNYIVLASCSGSAIGPIVGAFVEKNLSWHWVFWIQLIFGVAAQGIHLFMVPETRETSLIDKAARELRKLDPVKYAKIYGPGELKPKLGMRQIVTIWIRPFRMFVKEPIVFCLSLLSGFSDALIFLFIDSFHDVFGQWHFDTIQNGLTFVAIIVGYLVCYLLFLPMIRRHMGIRKRDPSKLQPEARLWLLLFLAPLLPFGLLGFAWTSFGPPAFHWMAPLTFAFFIAIANYAIYMATVDYMVAAYGEYSASATGGNALARDVLAGAAAMYAEPMYNKIGNGRWQLFWPSLILTILALIITVPVYIIYWKGPTIRKKSNFACELADLREVAGVACRKGTLADPKEVAMIHEKYQSTDDTLGPHASAQPESTRDAAAAKIANACDVKGGIADFSEIEMSPPKGGAGEQ